MIQLPRLLIADSDANNRQYIRQYAEYEGYTVIETGDGDQVAQMCRTVGVDLIIMDLVLNNTTGHDVLRELRSFSQTPVIVCSARSEEPDRLRCFSLGADDFVPKPFSPRELMMRAAAIRNRVDRPTNNLQPAPYTNGSLTVDFAARKVTVDGRTIDLSPKEYELLQFLVRNRNLALTRESLICEVWGYDFPGDERTLDTHIKLLRRKLGSYGRNIVTIRSVGYRFDG